MRSSLRVCSFSTHEDAGCLLTPAQASLSIREQQPGAGLTLERFPTASQENCFCSPALVTASLALIVINEIRSKSWRKLNTFLWLEIDKVLGKSLFHFFWKSVFARPLSHGASPERLAWHLWCPDASCPFLGSTLPWTRCSQANGQTEGTGKRPRMALVSLQGSREDWSGQHRESLRSKEIAGTALLCCHEGDPRLCSRRSFREADPSRWSYG